MTTKHPSGSMMGPTRLALLAIGFAVGWFMVASEARRVPVHKHAAVDADQGRQAGPRHEPRPPLSTSATQENVLTLITPSPGASPIAVTEQSQVVQSYVPQFTLCELPPLAFSSLSPAPSATLMTAPYHNYTVSTASGNGTCTTIYSITETMVCATVLSDLVTKYTVTNCAQDLTFSTRYGYVLATPSPTTNATNNETNNSSSALITPAPTIQNVTTYYLAPWQDLTSAGPPSDIELKVCSPDEDGSEQCTLEYEVWHTSLVTMTATSYAVINFTTAIQGPSQLIVETFIANVTEVITTVSMSTTMQLEYETEVETTQTTPVPHSTGPTVYETMTLLQASPEPTSTITIQLTSTIYAGTTTVAYNRS